MKLPEQPSSADCNYLQREGDVQRSTPSRNAASITSGSMRRCFSPAAPREMLLPTRKRWSGRLPAGEQRTDANAERHRPPYDNKDHLGV
jgi:hypothetical protein